MKFRAMVDCSGFRNRYWKAGQEVEVNESEFSIVPKHFTPVSGDDPRKKIELLKPVAMSQLNVAQEPKGGLALGVAQQNPQLDAKTFAPKRGRPRKE